MSIPGGIAILSRMAFNFRVSDVRTGYVLFFRCARNDSAFGKAGISLPVSLSLAYLEDLQHFEDLADGAFREMETGKGAYDLLSFAEHRTSEKNLCSSRTCCS